VPLQALEPWIPSCSPRLLSQLLFALARARAPLPPAALRACAGRAAALRGAFGPGDAAMLLWSLGVVAAPDIDALSSLEEAPTPGAGAAAGGGGYGSGGLGALEGGVPTGWLNAYLGGIVQVSRRAFQTPYSITTGCGTPR
jgi:hypothetical protein